MIYQSPGRSQMRGTDWQTKPAPDLILLDLGLPDGDGLSLASQLSHDGRTEIPIIFISARHDVRDKLAAFAVGAGGLHREAPLTCSNFKRA